VYFEHVPSEYYSVNMHIFGQKLKAACGSLNLDIPVGLCIDTCHLYASGISFADTETVRHYMLDIQNVGLPILIHLNDSVGDFGSFIDRHDVLGAKIWKEVNSGLKFIKNTPFPKILEIANCRSSLELLAEL
jgi:endonuclease IV